MFQEPVIAAMVILGLIALGEIISIATRARIPMLFTVLLGYLILIWTGLLPKQLIIDSEFVAVGAVLGTAPIVIHMGTLIPIESFKSQWRAVMIALIGIIIASLFIIPSITFLFDYKTAVAGTGPAAGGIIAVLTTSEGLRGVGFEALVTIPVLILALQSLFGMPLAINLLRKYAIKWRDGESFQEGTDSQVAGTIDQGSKDKHDKLWLPEKYQSNLILLFILFVGGAIAVALGKLTPVPYSLWSLAIGITFRLLGIFPPRIMEKANTFTIGMAGIIFVIIVMLNDITFQMFVGYLAETTAIITLGLIGIIAGGYIGSKLFKWDPFKGVPVALTAMFGFPGDYIVCEEVSRSVGRNQEEEKRILDEILSPMLVGGFASVTVGSVIISSILIQTL